jgi:hypothetical protein
MPTAVSKPKWTANAAIPSNSQVIEVRSSTCRRVGFIAGCLTDRA